MMYEAVQECGYASGVREDQIPFFEMAVCGNDYALYCPCGTY
jgi:hypothetical protein